MKKQYDLDVYKRYNRIKFNISLPWGQIKKIHTIGDIKVIEYYNHEEDKTNFKPCINNRDLGVSYGTLDKAIIGAMAHKYGDWRADDYIFRILDIK